MANEGKYRIMRNNRSKKMTGWIKLFLEQSVIYPFNEIKQILYPSPTFHGIVTNVLSFIDIRKEHLSVILLFHVFPFELVFPALE